MNHKGYSTMVLSLQLPTSLDDAEYKFEEACEALRESLRQCCEEGSPSAEGTLFFPRTIPRQICRASRKQLQSLYYHGEWARRYKDDNTSVSEDSNHDSQPTSNVVASGLSRNATNEFKEVSDGDGLGGRLRQFLRKGPKVPATPKEVASRVETHAPRKKEQEQVLEDEKPHNADKTIALEAETFSNNVIGRNYNDSFARILAILVCCEREDGPWLTPHKEAWMCFVKYCLDPEAAAFELSDRHLPLCKNCCTTAFGEHGAREFHHAQAAFAASVIMEGPMQDCDSELQMTCAKPISVEESLVDKRLPDHFRIVVWNGT